MSKSGRSNEGSKTYQSGSSLDHSSQKEVVWPSPKEGAALIEAFVRIEQKEVREALVEFVKRLSEIKASRN